MLRIICLLLVLGWGTGLAAQDCQYRVNENDEVTHISKRMMNWETWFSSKDEELKSDTDGGNIVGRVSMGDLSGSKELNLSITVMTTKANKQLGRIGVGYPLKIILEDGEMIELKAVSADDGTVDSKAKTTTFETSYKVSDELFEKFSTTGIKKMRIFWSESRFTDHDAIDTKLLTEQANCLH